MSQNTPKVIGWSKPSNNWKQLPISRPSLELDNLGNVAVVAQKGELLTLLNRQTGKISEIDGFRVNPPHITIIS